MGEGLLATKSEPLDEIFAQAGLGLAQLETTGRYTMVNDGYCRIVGRTRDELLALQLQDVTHPDDLPASLDAFIRVIETGATRVIDQRYLSGDGRPVRTRNTVSPVYDAHGNPQYVLVLTHETDDSRISEQPQTEAHLDLRVLIDAAADGFCCVDSEGKTTLSNAAFLRMLGFEREEDVLGKGLQDVVRHARPDGTPYTEAESPIYKAARSGTPAHVIDEIVFRADGTSFPAEYWVRPILREGQIRGAVCTFIDLSERKKAEARQELLNRELSHRVKNTLAMVQAIVGQTLRTTTTPQQAMQSINGRLSALSEAHTVLLRTRWGNASITDVVEGAVAVHRADPRRIQIDGTRLEVGSKTALALTLALHELCTNAAKYGALSNDSGTVTIQWSVTGGAADAHFHLTWTESGGPPVNQPTRKGFGSRLIADRFGSDFGGEAELRFNPDGVVWTLDVTLAAMRD
jgi:PAS domain S-box-containing protein